LKDLLAIAYMKEISVGIAKVYYAFLIPMLHEILADINITVD
jgi:hypothetical protein